MIEKNMTGLRLSWRPALATDVSACLKISPRISGEEALGKRQAHSAWKDLMLHPAFQSAVIETEQPVLGSRTVGFGSSVFVQNDYAKGEMEHPRRGVAHRILCGIAAGKSPLLSENEIKQNNTLEGLNVIILNADVRPDLEALVALKNRVQPLLTNAFLACQSGYRLRRMLLEVTDPVLRQRVEAMQIWRMQEHEIALGHDSPYVGALAFMEREDALRQRESVSALLFNYQEPRLRLTTAEQNLLLAALSGSPDREISKSLGISKETIKTRWLTILRKAEDRMPDIFPDDDGAEHIGRGPQRRHHLMQFLRMHPEELRLFDWSKIANSASSRL